MTSLHIKDLSLAQPLDREAASAVRGGIAYIERPPAEPGIAPGGCVTPPWPLPAMPDFPWAPGWRGTPVPQGTPMDPGLLM